MGLRGQSSCYSVPWPAKQLPKGDVKGGQGPYSQWWLVDGDLQYTARGSEKSIMLPQMVQQLNLVCCPEILLLQTMHQQVESPKGIV